MSGLRPSGSRLNLMRAINAGQVEFDPHEVRYVRYEDGHVAEVVTSRFNTLRSAGLVRQVHFTETELTDPAGRRWLAEHDKEN